MCCPGTNTVMTTPQPPTAEQTRMNQLAVDSMQQRANFLPYLLYSAGYRQTGNPNQPIEQLAPTPERQAMTQLGQTSLGGANESANMLLQRLRASQSMLPNLLAQIRASQPPGMPQQPGVG